MSPKLFSTIANSKQILRISDLLRPAPENLFPDSAHNPRTNLHEKVIIRRTTVKLTSGKLAGMKAVSDKRGVIAAAAMDQRGSLQKALAKEKGSDASTSIVGELTSLATKRL